MQLALTAASARSARCLLAALLTAGGAAPAAAEIAVFAFAGEVTEVVADGGLFGPAGTIQVGHAFTGHFAYETGPANADQQPEDPALGVYELLAFQVDQSSPLLELTFLRVGVHHEPGLVTLPPDPPDPGLDGVSVAATSNAYPAVSLALSAPYGSVFADDALPSELDLADFPDGATLRGLVAVGIGGNPNIQDVGAVTSLTRLPEPGAAGLAGAAALSLAALRRAALPGRPACGLLPGRIRL